MKTKCVLSGCFLLLSLALACTVSIADTRSAGEQAIRDLEEQWSKAAGAKDVEKVISFYADDAIVLPPNASAATTKEAIRQLWTGMFATPGASLSWKTTKVEIGKSGNMAYATGTYEFTMNDPSGKPTTEPGKYITVWEKRPDGKWKCRADIWNSDTPASPVAAAEKK
jgi:uncharacterized protein (TIGR02246 family)